MYETSERRKSVNARLREAVENLEAHMGNLNQRVKAIEEFEAYTSMEAYIANVVRKVLKDKNNGGERIG